MAEEKGFEPLRRLRDLSVFKTGPFNQTWVFLQRQFDYITVVFRMSTEKNVFLMTFSLKLVKI